MPLLRVTRIVLVRSAIVLTSTIGGLLLLDKWNVIAFASAPFLSNQPLEWWHMMQEESPPPAYLKDAFFYPCLAIAAAATVLSWRQAPQYVLGSSTSPFRRILLLPTLWLFGAFWIRAWFASLPGDEWALGQSITIALAFVVLASLWNLPRTATTTPHRRRFRHPEE